jgi:pimeloyl-ACP methyl ester carboxylesterase
MAAHPTELPPLPLPEGIIETYVKTNDLIFHVLSAGTPGQPLILCLHGFLGLAWSWHEIMPLLAMGGYHVIAYDQRGYGRTTGWDTRSWSEVDLHTFTFQRLVIDAERLVMALGYTKVTMVLGHGFGSVVANLCALIRPDIFKRYDEEPPLFFSRMGSEYQTV